MPATSAAQQRIGRLATLTAVHRAFHWLHLHQPQLRQWQLELVRIPAPPFGESSRAARNPPPPLPPPPPPPPTPPPAPPPSSSTSTHSASPTSTSTTPATPS